MKKSILLLAIPLAAFVLGCTPSPSDGGGGTQVESQNAHPVNSEAKEAAQPTGPFVAFKDGQYEVGTGNGQVKPGKYKTTVPAGSHCYWERQKDLDGSFDSIITNGNGDADTPVIITIKPTDKGFKSRGCGEWKLA